MNIIRDYLVELAKYLPEFLRQDPEMKAILEVESAEHRVQVEILKDIQKQFFVDTATWGLALFEKELGLKPNASDNYEQRRNRIFLYLQQRKTVNKEFIEELFYRYVSEGSQIVVMEDNPDNTFWVIDTGGRILYPDDLHEAIETYKPAHLRFGLEIRRDLTMTEEDMIRLAVVSLFEGYRSIGVAVPEREILKLNTSIIPAQSGIIRIGTGPETFAETFPLGVRIGHRFTGIRDIAVSKEDLPQVFKEAAARLAPILGFATDLRGVRTLPLALPEEGILTINSGAVIQKTGIRQYGLAPPERGILIPSVGIADAHGGRKDIAADRGDLPEWFKDILDSARIAEYIGTADRTTGQKKIGVAEPEQGRLPFAAGFLHGIFGVATVGIDAGDLPRGFAERLSRAAALLGIAARAQGYRRVSLALPETAKAAFGVSLSQKWSGTRVVPLASPEEADIRQGVGTANANGGRRTLPADIADLPKWFRNALTDAQAAEYIATALYTQGIRKTSLTLPQEAAGLFGVGTTAEQNGKREIGIDESDLPELCKNILEDTNICSFLGIEITRRGWLSIGLAPVTEEKPLQVFTGQTAKRTGAATIRADPEDLPDYFKGLSEESRAALFAGLKILQTAKRHISLAEPEEGRAALGVTFAGTQGGTRSILPAMPEDGKAEETVGLAAAFGGRRDIPADEADIPAYFKNILEDAHAAFFVGMMFHTHGIRKALLTRPQDATGVFGIGSIAEKNGTRKISIDLNDLPAEYQGSDTEARIAPLVGVNALRRGNVLINLALPSREAEAKVFTGRHSHFSGVSTIEADESDLPEWYTNILEPSRAAVCTGMWTGERGEKRISLAAPEEERSKFYHGTAGAVTGYVVIGADLSDLNPPRRKAGRFHVGLSHVGAMAVG